jgi:hypothetical protein
MRTLSYFPLVLGLVASLPEHRLRGMLTVNSNQTRQTQAVGRVVKLRLIDADTDQPIAAYDPLPTPLAEVDLSRLGSATNFNIEAITDGIVGSILWKNNGITRNEDNSSRWALCGNKGSDFSSCGGFRLGGSISISAMPFTGRASSGTPGVALSTQVTIVSSTAPDVKPPKLTLINADTNLDIGELLGGAIIDLSKTPRLNVRAEPDPSVATGSVRFEYDERWFRTENGAIFAFAGNQGIDYFSWTPSVGVHTITATAHRDRDASGTEWPKSSVTFSVVSQPQAPTPAAPFPAAPIVTPRPQASVSKKTNCRSQDEGSP